MRRLRSITADGRRVTPRVRERRVRITLVGHLESIRLRVLGRRTSGRHYVLIRRVKPCGSVLTLRP